MKNILIKMLRILIIPILFIVAHFVSWFIIIKDYKLNLKYLHIPYIVPFQFIIEFYKYGFKGNLTV